jgi:ABC-type glycerol-3-phosphate transport system substrate-binding protein
MQIHKEDVEMSKRFSFFIVALLLLSLVATACKVTETPEEAASPTTETEEVAPTEEITEAEPSEAPPEPTEPEEVSITFVTHDYEPTRPLHERFVAEYMELHPNVEINFVTYPQEDLVTKIITGTEAGRGPTVMGVFGPWIASLVKGGYLDEAPDWVREAQEEDFPQIAIDGATIDGKLYGLVWQASDPIPLISVELWDAAGITEDEYPTTYEEMIDLLPRLDKKSDTGEWEVQGICLRPFGFWAVVNWITILKNYGVEILNEDYSAAAFNTPEGLAATNVWRQLSYPDADSTLFGLKQCGMVWYGTWYLPLARATYPDIELTFLPPFSGPVSQLHPVWTWHWAVNAHASQAEKDAAWDFIGYLSTAESQLASWSESNIVPTRNSAFADESLQSDELLQIYASHMDKSFVYYPMIPEWEQIEKAITTTIERFGYGEISAEEFLTEAEAEVNSILAGE